MYSIELERRVAAPPDVVWAVMTDMDAYAAHAPNLNKVEVISGEGVGMVRRCEDIAGKSWRENCVLWEDGSQYAMEVDMSDYPYPMTYMKGTWSLEAVEGGTLVSMRFTYQPKSDPPLIGGLINRMSMRPSLERVAGKLMDNWEAEMLKRSAS